MGIAEKRLAMFDALLSGRGLQGLVDAAAELFGNPVVVVDMGLAMVAVSSELADDPEWSVPAYDPEDSDIRQASVAGDFRRVYSSDKTVVGEYLGARNRYLAARIRRGDVLLGHALVLERNRGFTEEDKALVPDVCRTFGYELAGSSDADQPPERYGRLVGDLLTGTLTDSSEVEARIRSARIKLPERMCVLIAHPFSDSGQITPRYLRLQLLRVFEDSIGVVRGEDVFMVIDAMDAGDDLQERLDRSMVTESLAVGLSYSFSGLVNLKRASEQASAALRLTTGRKGIIRYQQVVARHMLERVSLSTDPELFMHPAVGILSAIDARENSTHLEDLDAYLSHGRNATSTARALHVHKNTMYYRLQRIEELAGVDLSDEETCFALQLSLEARANR